MGMFDFLKKKPQTEFVNFDNLPEWLDSLVEKKNLQSRVEKFKEKLNLELDYLKDRLHELEEASLMNDNIPEKAKQIMEGNRENFLRRMNSFMETIQVPDDYKQIGFFASKLSEDVTKLGEDTQKAFFVLKEFFDEEVKRTTGSIKKIEDIVIAFMRDLDKENIGLVDEVKLDLKELSDEKKKKKEIASEIEGQEKKVKDFKDKEVKVLEKLDELRSTKTYKDFEETHKKKEGAISKKEELRSELKSVFSVLGRALKKYAHNSPNEKIVMEYLEDPLDALLSDDLLRIASVLHEVKDELENLDLKEDKVEKSKNAIDELSREFLEAIRQDHDDLKFIIDGANKRLRGNVTALNITEQEGFLKTVRSNVEEHEKFKEELQAKLESIDPELLKSKIKEKVHELADVVFEDS